MKKIAILPLCTMIFCGIAGLSSVLKYQIREFLLIIPILFVVALYYGIIYVISVEKERTRIRIGMVATLAIGLLFSLLFSKFIYSGFQNIMFQMAERWNFSYTTGVILEEEGDAAYAVLAFFGIAGICTTLSLWLFETKKPLTVTALPPFFIFCISLAADGVPKEWCIIGFGVALPIFLILGRWATFKKSLLITGLSGGILLLGVLCFPWSQMNPVIMEYRTLLQEKWNTQGGNGSGGGTDVVQKIQFGTFEKSGYLEYENMVALNLYTRIDLRHNSIFLRGFVGNEYKENRWTGKRQKLADPMGLAMQRTERLEVENVYDPDIYYPYIVEEEMPSGYQKRKIQYTTADMKEVSGWDLDVDAKLRKEIETKILEDFRPKNIGEAQEFVEKYLYYHYQYTTRPGKMDEEDELSKFLFERKTGYCTHYASAAVMIFRTMGIPARLAQGYMMSGNQLKIASWNPVYDKNAHAWVEIYIPDAGWYPLDVTSYAVPVMGEEELYAEAIKEERELAKRERQKEEKEELSEMLKDEQSEEEPSEEEQPEEEQPEEEQPEKEQDRSLVEEVIEATPSPSPTVDGSSVAGDALAIMAAILLNILILVAAIEFLLYWYRRKKVIRQIEREKSATGKFLRMHAELERYLEKIGIIFSYESQQKTYDNLVGVLCYYIPSAEISKVREDTKKYVACCFQYRYGKDDMTEDEFMECMDYLQFIFETLQKNPNQKGWKKIKKCCIVDVVNKRKKDR